MHIDGNVSKPRISKMHIVQETQKTVSNKLATECFLLLFLPVDFAFVFWYEPLTLYREWYPKYISVKISFLSKIIK